MDITNWKHLHKFDYKFPELSVATNVLYTPYLNDDMSILCMWFDETNSYMSDSCVTLSNEICEFYFFRELEYLRKFQGNAWCPKILEVIEDERKIFIEYNSDNCNHLLLGSTNLDELYPSWEDDVKNIVYNMNDLGYYKMSLYPHCFFYDKNKNLKTIDFYATVDKKDSLIKEEIIAPIIGVDSEHRFNRSTNNGYVDFTIFFQQTLLYFSKWPTNIFNDLYRKLYND